MELAPIALFVYSRLEHTKKVIDALKKNDLANESKLFIFSDGPKTKEKEKDVEQVRKYLKTINGFKSIKIFESKKNKGLANSIIEGVTKIVNKYGKIIVLEDDIVTSKYFLKFMNDALDKYQMNSNVASISGYVYPVKNLPETFFIRGAECWGWATWKMGWRLFEKDGKKLLNQLNKTKLIDEFDFNGAYKFSQMLKDQISGKNNSWAVRWYASIFLNNKLTLYPNLSFVSNIGNMSGGTHNTSRSKWFDTKLSDMKVTRFEMDIHEKKEIRKKFEDFFKRYSSKTFRIYYKIISFF